MGEYGSFQELAAAQRLGLDYAIRLRMVPGAAVVLAPHGGGIEPGTSEIADALAGAEFSFYAFEGLKHRGNARLHLASTLFDEPQCLALLQQASGVIAIHGEQTNEAAVFVGGRHVTIRDRVLDALVAARFPATIHPNPNLQGADPNNICNRSCPSGGVQLEISVGFRILLFKDLSASGRKLETPRFQEFVVALRKVLAREYPCALTRE